MEALGIVPSASIKFHFGLFCAGNFYFGPEPRRVLEEIGNFSWDEVRKINVKEELLVHLHNQEVRHIPLDKLDFMRRYACQYCDDYSAEYADLSFGGLGAPEGWTTVISRTSRGNLVMAEARGIAIELYRPQDNLRLDFQALAQVLARSEEKKRRAALHHQELEARGRR
jgi:coenzyme F420 hydrogenase subunit beta